MAIDQNALSLDVSSPPFNSFPEVISLSGASDPVGLTVTPNDLYLLTADAGLNEGAIYDICGTQIGTFDGLNPGSAIGVAYNAHY